MAAPVQQTRGTPGGKRLKDGYQTLVAFKNDLDISLYEREVTPPAIIGGDPIDITTMHNTTWVQYALQALKEMGQASGVCGYDPEVLDQIIAIVNDNTTVSIMFPDNSSWDFFGGLIEFEPTGLVRGEFPEANFTIACTQTDEADDELEVGPNYTTPSGTA